MAKTTYKDWEADEKILLLQGWARNGLTNEQDCKQYGYINSYPLGMAQEIA